MDDLLGLHIFSKLFEIFFYYYFLLFQAEICSTALTDVIHAVINGTDGCLFCFGHAKLGKCNLIYYCN